MIDVLLVFFVIIGVCVVVDLVKVMVWAYKDEAKNRRNK